MKEDFKAWREANKVGGRSKATKLLGIPFGTYKNWETGRSRPTAANLDYALGNLEEKDPRLWEDLCARLGYEKALATTKLETGKKPEHSQAETSLNKSSQPAGHQSSETYLEESLKQLSTHAKNRDYDSLERDFLDRGSYLVQVVLGNLLLEGAGQKRARDMVREQLSRQLGILEETGFAERRPEPWIRGPWVGGWAQFLESLLDKKLVDANFRKAIDQAIGIKHTLWAVADFMIEVRKLEELVSLLETPSSDLMRLMKFGRQVSADELLGALSEPLRAAYAQSDLGLRHFSNYQREFVEPVQSIREPVERLCNRLLRERAQRDWENRMHGWWKQLRTNLKCRDAPLKSADEPSENAMDALRDKLQVCVERVKHGRGE